MPGNLRKKPSKPNEDFAKRRRWRTSSALLLPLPLPLSTGSLGCIMSCILIHNEWRIGEVPMEFFCLFLTFPFFNFFRHTLCICRSRLWAAELYLYGPERKSPFLILMIAPHIGPETLSRVWILRMCIRFTLLPRNIIFGILCCTTNQTDSKDCFDTQPSKRIFQMWQNRSWLNPSHTRSSAQ